MDKDVEEAAFSSLTLVTSLMSEHLNLLAIELELLRFGDSRRSRALIFELNVAEAAALSVGVKLEFARADWANGGKCLVELLLGDGKVDVADEDVGLWLHKVTFLKVAANEICTDLRVVHLRGAAAGLVGGEELEEAVAVLTLSLLINVDDCLENVVA